MSLRFSKEDIEAILNGSPLVEKKGFKVSHDLVATHPKSKEYVVKGVSPKGDNFSFGYAKIADRALTIDSVLNSGRNGFWIEKAAKEEDHLIFKVDRPKTELEELSERLEDIPNKLTSNVFSVMTEEEVRRIYNEAYKKFEKNEISFANYKVYLFKEAIAYGLNVDALHHALIALNQDIKKFRPSPSYVLSEVIKKTKKKIG